MCLAQVQVPRRRGSKRKSDAGNFLYWLEGQLAMSKWPVANSIALCSNLRLVGGLSLSLSFYMHIDMSLYVCVCLYTKHMHGIVSD